MYEFIRNILCPFEKIEKYVPRAGKILDVGCGHGILARLMAKKPKRNILAVDPSKDKILIAKKSTSNKNLKFENKYIKDVRGKFDCVTVVDVLYLLPKRKKLNFLNEAYRLLKKNGVLVIKEVNTKPEWMLWLSSLEESIVVKLLKYTHTDYKKIYLDSPDVTRSLIRSSGFKLRTEESFFGRLGYPSHILFVATKK